MKLVNFYAGEKVCLGIKTDKGIINVEKTASNHNLKVPTTIEQVINGNMKAIAELKELVKLDNPVLLEEDIVYAPIVTNPEKIICVGLNYAPHVEESKMDLPKNPVLFSKFNNALAAHKQTIQLPKVDEKFDYEAELVIVIGKEAANISEEEALSHVFGYTVGNDLSARSLQFVSGQWLLGKSLDNFAPIGPYLVTADDIDPNNLDIRCEVNGELRQSGNTREMIFDIATIISYVSKHITLSPGDVIFSGTPEGVIIGYPEEEQVWLKSGDKVAVSIENIGELVNVLE